MDLAAGLEVHHVLTQVHGGGGVSELQVESKKTAYLAAENAVRAAQGRLGELEFRLSQESDRASVELETSDQELTRLRLQYDAALREMANEENKLRLQLQSARLAANAAQRVRFENIDKDNFLLILAPVSELIGKHNPSAVRRACSASSDSSRDAIPGGFSRSAAWM